VKLVFTLLARRDLVRLRGFIAPHDPAAARRMAARIRAVVETITEHPLIGRPVVTPDGDTREDVRELPLPFGGSGYLLRYQVVAEEVRVLRVWHSREDRSE